MRRGRGPHTSRGREQEILSSNGAPQSTQNGCWYRCFGALACSLAAPATVVGSRARISLISPSRPAVCFGECRGIRPPGLSGK